ncbi:Hypothetical_protein [Hexamita inflata]|uniref:Hypothetical_protein n=1 Tax=Hexamita inflata TaxID=28002 RepID=A0ABP1JU41_9EUKA
MQQNCRFQRDLTYAQKKGSNQNKHYFWDLCICQNNSTMNREYKSKLETHAKNYKVPQDQILPLIISDNLTIHQESLIHIKKFIKNPQNLLNQIGKSILTAHSNRTLSYNQKIKQHSRNEQASIQYDLENNHDHRDTTNNQSLEISISKHKI